MGLVWAEDGPMWSNLATTGGRSAARPRASCARRSCGEGAYGGRAGRCRHLERPHRVVGVALIASIG
jgi:hypothetical protein